MNRKNVLESIIQEARIFATAAHAAVGQTRKYTGEPYFYHPAEVAHLVAEYTNNDPELVAAAWLHDVLEDTSVEIGLLESLFGKRVADLVAGVTDVSKPEDGNRPTRKAIDRAHIAKQPPECKTIKLADLISNAASIVRHDPAFAEVYLEEKVLVLDVLSDGCPELYKLAVETVEAGIKDLKEKSRRAVAQ